MTIPRKETKSGIVYGQAQRYSEKEWGDRVFRSMSREHEFAKIVCLACGGVLSPAWQHFRCPHDNYQEDK